MELQGVIKTIGQTKEFGAKAFKKRELVLTTEGVHKQDIAIVFMQDKCLELDKYKVGQGVIIGIDILGREWTSPEGEVKHFNTIKGWKIDPTPIAAPPVAPQQGNASPSWMNEG